MRWMRCHFPAASQMSWYSLFEAASDLASCACGFAVHSRLALPLEQPAAPLRGPFALFEPVMGYVDEALELGKGELLDVTPSPSLPDEEITCLREGVRAGVARVKAVLTRPATAFPRRTNSSLNTTSSAAS